MTAQRTGLHVAHRVYKTILGPFLHGLMPGGCKFQPTCSEYAALAVAEHGWVQGSAMATWRLLRCQPFAKGGWDPVPARKDKPPVHPESPNAQVP